MPFFLPSSLSLSLLWIWCCESVKMRLLVLQMLCWSYIFDFLLGDLIAVTQA